MVQVPGLPALSGHSSHAEQPLAEEVRPARQFDGRSGCPRKSVPGPVPQEGYVTVVGGNPVGHFPLTAAEKAAAPPSRQKQMFAEPLLPLVSKCHPALASRITRALLLLGNQVLLHLLSSEQALLEKPGEIKASLEAVDYA